MSAEQQPTATKSQITFGNLIVQSQQFRERFLNCGKERGGGGAVLICIILFVLYLDETKLFLAMFCCMQHQ